MRAKNESVTVHRDGRGRFTRKPPDVLDREIADLIRELGPWLEKMVTEAKGEARKEGERNIEG
ncbi:MAG: hypothetical protein FJ279_16600 [Planctomycetes bacterium]|nr:hypothetical protein [Planctomycetota bacterium]